MGNPKETPAVTATGRTAFEVTTRPGCPAPPDARADRVMSAETSAPAAGGATLDPDRLVRWSSIVVVVAVAIGAGVVSYGHAYELVRTHGESGPAALIGPATVDGLMYASGMVLLQAARYGQRAPRLAYFGLWLGILATIGANVAHGVGHGWVGALVSAWPAVALIVSYELLMRLIRTGTARGVEPVEDHPNAEAAQCPHGVAESAEEAVRLAWLHARDCVGEPLSQRRLAAAFGVDRKRVAALVVEVAPVSAADKPDEATEDEPTRRVEGGRTPLGATGPAMA